MYAFHAWVGHEDRRVGVAVHLMERIWAVARSLRDDPRVLIDMQAGIPPEGRIALDSLLAALPIDEHDSFLLELLNAFPEACASEDLLEALMLLVLGMATRLGGWIWLN